MVFGFWEAVAILGIVLVIFGAGRLPTVMGDLAKGIRTFKAGLKDPDEPSPPTTVAEPGKLPPPAESDRKPLG